jgi:membrane-associated phospholipid phosphatase
MPDLLHFVLGLDRHATELGTELRWEPATALFAFVSLWWIKGPVLVAAGWCADLYSRRRLPFIAFAATSSFFLASAGNALLKDLFERDRPPAVTDVSAAVPLPGSSSFPSGHAMTAFATAAAISALAPRLRVPMFAVAVLISCSRVYLGVHFVLDVLVGSLLGLAIGLLVARPLRERCCGGDRLATAPA